MFFLKIKPLHIILAFYKLFFVILKIYSKLVILHIINQITYLSKLNFSEFPTNSIFSKVFSVL